MQTQVTNLRYLVRRKVRRKSAMQGYRRVRTDCADGHTVCGEKHRIANETAKEIGHADAGYKPALPENVDCVCGHTICGEKYWTAYVSWRDV